MIRKRINGFSQSKEPTDLTNGNKVAPLTQLSKTINTLSEWIHQNEPLHYITNKPRQTFTYTTTVAYLSVNGKMNSKATSYSQPPRLDSPKPQRARKRRSESLFDPLDAARARQHQDLSEDSEQEVDVPVTMLPSNQLADQTPPPAASQSLFDNLVDEAHHEDHEVQSEDHHNEFDQLNLLTQYIGGPSETTVRRKEISPMGDEELKKAELAKLKQNYLELTDLIDRGESHLAALDRAIERKRIPAKLQITITPMVLNKENADFQREWAEAKLQAEILLIQTIRRHLITRIINPSREKIRKLSRDTFCNLRRLASSSEVGTSLDSALQEADQERKSRNQTRLKKKQEAATANRVKKQKLDKKL